MNPFWRIFLLIKTFFFLKIAENWIFRHNLLMVFFQGTFCKVVLCKLWNQRTWDSQVSESEMPNRGAWSKWLKSPYIYGSHWHNITKSALLLSKTLPQKNGSRYKRNLTKMTPHKNSISLKWHIKTFIIAFLKYYQHPAIKTYLYN